MNATTDCALRVWAVTNFRGWYPTQAAAVVVAASADDARALLFATLPEQLRVDQDASRWTVEEVETAEPNAVILSDGDY